MINIFIGSSALPDFICTAFIQPLHSCLCLNVSQLLSIPLSSPLLFLSILPFLTGWEWNRRTCVNSRLQENFQAKPNHFFFCYAAHVVWLISAVADSQLAYSFCNVLSLSFDKRCGCCLNRYRWGNYHLRASLRTYLHDCVTTLRAERMKGDKRLIYELVCLVLVNFSLVNI